MKQRVQDVMSSIVMTLRPDMTLAEARDLFVHHKVTGAPVVDSDGNLCGVFSQRDLVESLVSAELFGNIDEDYWGTSIGGQKADHWKHVAVELRKRCIADVMSENLHIARPEDSLSLVARTMRKHRIHRVVVVSDGKVVGIVTPFDLLEVVEDI